MDGQSVINASTGGKTIVLHFSPGPSFPPIVRYPVHPDPPYNSFLALDWPGHWPDTDPGTNNFSSADAGQGVWVRACGPGRVGQ